MQLYLLLMSERYGRQGDAGLLHYLGSRDPKLIPYHHLTIQASRGLFAPLQRSCASYGVVSS